MIGCVKWGKRLISKVLMSEQPTKLRRAVVVPKSKMSADMLRDEQSPDVGDLIHYPITQETYQVAFGFFNDLARQVGIETDDYAVTEVEVKKLDELINFVRLYPSGGSKELGALLDRIQGMGYQAKKLGLPMYFVL